MDNLTRQSNLDLVLADQMGTVIVVDAIDDSALSFYEHHNFVRIEQTRRLVMNVATARHALRR